MPIENNSSLGMKRAKSQVCATVYECIRIMHMCMHMSVHAWVYMLCVWLRAFVPGLEVDFFSTVIY